MIKRTIEISKEPAHLSVKLGQLLIQRHEADPRTAASIPCEDIGLVMVDNTQTTYSHYALAKLMEYGAAVVICGHNHLPAGLLLPIPSHTEVVWRIQDQMNVSKPTCKQLWRQIVIAKIRAQAANLEPDTPTYSKLLALARTVRSGDPTNVEAQAARAYWAAWLGDSSSAKTFRRNTDPPKDDALNAMLNYGYAILRAAVARALVAAGLHPAVGIHHSNRSNAFCLADDLVEPIRPLADARVRNLYQWGMETLNQGAKAHLLQLLTDPVQVGDQTGPLMVGLHRYVASLVQCYQGSQKKLLLPVAVNEHSC